MTDINKINSISHITEAVLGAPFVWSYVKGGSVTLIDASKYGGTRGGTYKTVDFAIAKYLITNSQYQKFLEHPNGFRTPEWWTYSPEGSLWRRDHHKPKPTAFDGANLPRTRVSWFDATAFCIWLSAETNLSIRLPTEQEWQRAATGDTGWEYPCGNEINKSSGNFANQIGRTSPVGSYPNGQSPFGVMDMAGNLWEWCLTTWGTDSININGYTYRVFRGGAWNVSNLEHLRSIDRGEGHSPRGQLNDLGFRITLQFS